MVLRRDIVDLREMLIDNEVMKNVYIVMLSGSKREGFRLYELDRDIMIWLNDY